MTRKYDFVTRLMSGKAEASAKTRWWPRHSRAMARYLSLSSGGNAGAALKSVREMMMMGATEWEVSICRGAHPSLMTEHSAFEIALIDAAMRKDVKSMELAVQKLCDNAKAQTELYAGKVEGFPASTWYTLMLQHCKLFAESARHFMERDDRGFNGCEERRQQNTLALASCTAEWL